MQTILRLILVTSACLMFTSCSLFSPVTAPAEANYKLQPVIPAKHYGKRHTLNKTILVTMPNAVPMLGGTQMAYSDKPMQIGYFVYNHWAETPSQMLQEALVNLLEKDKRFKVVLMSPSAGVFDYCLSSYILDFTQDYNHYPAQFLLKVRIQFQNLRTGQVFFAKQFVIREPISARTPGAGVIAANHALSELLRRVNIMLLHVRH